ncbi:N-acetylmuramoyl-L-alanine amidase [Thermomonas carbonis]|uniref:N-acetylmuramoyl-L-alanine amidase AmiC n=1 Tax=Thermomonas carbonis TaxID=1463158 RepID=A0A7G9SV39_9GAMM|nr:N-acetylmuramoyl-L-alanine amidase [Thermomonas carbonis]QNN71714.1 N-acetylmuramoyl-L-alanine amidase [Thermomonas carbonis]
MLLAALCWNLANASEIKQLRVETGATGTRVELQLDRPGDYKVIELRNPDRLVVDFADSRLARNLSMPAGAGAVKAVRTGQPQPGIVRVVFDLASQVKAMPPRIETTAAGPRLVLEWPGDAAVALTTPVIAAPIVAAKPDPIAEIAKASAAVETDPGKVVGKAATVSELPGTVATGVPTRVATGKPEPMPTETPAAAAPIPRPVMQAGMRPLVISIDAGHGGQDPGAIGPNGNREKNVTLAIARELARQINATPGMKAHLTRDADVFIPLNRRAVLARGAKADIFVSIHADAAENRSATGSSVYVMSTRGASSQRARWLADKENAADLIGGVKLAATGDTLKSVLLDLTQSGQMKASSDAAAHVLGSLGSVGKTRRVEHANFAVLRTSDVPAMLVETGFISNHGEEALLSSPDYQRKLATAVLAGINEYFTRQPPPGTLYAARAHALQVSQAASTGTGANSGGSP